MPAPQFKYLRPEDIKNLGSFEFAPKALVEGYFAGRHRSRLRGSSTEFRDYRPYAFGDEPKLVDWRVYARTDRFYLRTYEEQTRMDCYIFLDSSASMGFGEGLTKLEYASFFAAALCYLVTRNTDRVALNLFDERVRHFFPPGSTTRHLHNLLHVLERNQPGQRTSLATALRRAYPLLRYRGALVVLSDFFDDSAAIFSALSPYLHRGFRIFLFHVLAPEELQLRDLGLRMFDDMETGGRVVAHTRSIGTAYAAAMEQHIRGLRALAVRRQVAYTVARTDRHYFSLFDELVG